MSGVARCSFRSGPLCSSSITSSTVKRNSDSLHHQIGYLIQRRYFSRRKLMRGILTWHKWHQKSFRAAVYKYVNEDDYNTLRRRREALTLDDHFTSDDSLTNEDKSRMKSYSLMQNDMLSENDWISQEMSMNEHNSSDTYRNHPSVYPGDARDAQRVSMDRPRFNLNSAPSCSGMRPVSVYGEWEANRDDYSRFQKDLWRKYAYKTFIIDRSKYGNLPVYQKYVRSTRCFVTTIRGIRGNIDDFEASLQAYLGKDVDIVKHQAFLRIYGKKHYGSIKRFLLEMGF